MKRSHLLLSDSSMLVWRLTHANSTSDTALPLNWSLHASPNGLSISFTCYPRIQITYLSICRIKYGHLRQRSQGLGVKIFWLVLSHTEVH